MAEFPRVRISGGIEGDYVVLEQCAGGILRIAPARPDRLPRLVALRKTCTACPSQWEGELEDGRAVYARYRHGELSVGVGSAIEEAIRNSGTDQALHVHYVGNGLDGFMDLDELKLHLYGLLEFPTDLTDTDEQANSPVILAPYDSKDGR